MEPQRARELLARERERRAGGIDEHRITAHDDAACVGGCGERLHPGGILALHAHAVERGTREGASRRRLGHGGRQPPWACCSSTVSSAVGRASRRASGIGAPLRTESP
jgi:hypothetical protein